MINLVDEQWDFHLYKPVLLVSTKKKNRSRTCNETERKGLIPSLKIKTTLL